MYCILYIFVTIAKDLYILRKGFIYSVLIFQDQDTSLNEKPADSTMEPPLSNLARSRRNAVSASVMSEEDATSYVKKVRKISGATLYCNIISVLLLLNYYTFFVVNYHFNRFLHSFRGNDVTFEHILVHSIALVQ